MSHGVIFKGFKNKLEKFVYKLVFKNEISKENFLNLENWYQNDNFEYGMIYYMYYYCGHHACWLYALLYV